MSLLALYLLSFVTIIFAQEETCGSPNNGPVAKGVDFVDLWTRYEATKQVPKPEMGSQQYAVMYDGYEFYFRNSSNAVAFKTNPTKYAPQYGCYCGWAMV